MIHRLFALMTLTLVACGGDRDGGDVPGDGDGDADSSNGEIPLDVEPRGTLNVFGTSAAAGTIDFTFQGPADTTSGNQAVSCKWHPDGASGSGVPEIEVLAGFAGERSSVHAKLTGTYTLVGEHTYVHGSTASNDDLELRARLTFDSPNEFYEYALDSTAEDHSSCVVDIETDHPYLSGSISCRDLFPTGDSLDVYEDGTLASIAIEFECPLVDPNQPQGSGGSSGTGGTSAGGSSSGGSGTGGSSGGGTCTGIASSCSTLSEVSCGNALGCSWHEDCLGFSESCYSQYSSYACNGLDGCYWSSYSTSCSGSSWSCSLYSSSLSCTYQGGCYWDDGCEGIPWACSDFSTLQGCLQHPGCSWETDL